MDARNGYFFSKMRMILDIICVKLYFYLFLNWNDANY